MNDINLIPQNPEDWSDIKVTYQMGSSRLREHYDILVIAYSGKYGIGSAGNGDAQYMYARGQFGLNIYEPAGAILDFRELEYVWGDLLAQVFDIQIEQYPDTRFPLAMVVGDKCKEAIGTLIHFGDESEPATSEDWIFDSLEEAWKYVEEKIEENRLGDSAEKGKTSNK